MAYDDIIPLLGGFGRYQKRVYFLIVLPAIVCAFHKFGNVFLVAKSDHRCRLPGEPENANFTLPENEMEKWLPYDNKTEKFSSCTFYENGTIETCESYIYDHSKYQSSAYMEMNMVCNRAYMKSTGDSLFMVGIMLGSMLFGELSDRYGRKPTFFIALVVQVVFGLIAAFAPEYWTFTITRLIVGATTQGVFLVAYVIAMEMVSPKKRLMAGTVCQMSFTIGYILVAPIAYYITEWRHLQIALTIPGVIFFTYWWFIPESTRWLITKNRIDEAKANIYKAAKENKLTLDDSVIENLLVSERKPEGTEEKKANIIDIFKHPNLRKRSLIVFFDWFSNSITYYGLSWNTSNLGGNDYINFVIAAAVEIPAYTICILTLNRFGRKKILCSCMGIAGAALLLTIFVPDEQNWLIVTLAMIGKLAITSSYGTIYIFSTEQFPTVIRNAALGAGSVAARLGSIFAPFINETSVFFRPLPLLVFGSLSLIGGCLSLVLPETLNKALPETIADGEMFGRRETSVEKEEDEEAALKSSGNGVAKNA